MSGCFQILIQIFLDRGWNVQEVQVRDGDMGGAQRLCDEEGQDVDRQSFDERHHPGEYMIYKSFMININQIFLFLEPIGWDAVRKRERDQWRKIQDRGCESRRSQVIIFLHRILF